MSARPTPTHPITTNAEHVSTTTINDLPVELLQEIFFFCTADHNCRTFPFVVIHRSATRAPVVLTHVCSLWRRVALSLPMLWASFTLLPLKRASEELVTEWLKRSHSSPLAIDASQLFKNLSRKTCSSILAQSHRWRYLGLRPGDRLMSGFLDTPPSAAPALKGLAIKSSTFAQLQPYIASLSAKLSTLPSLQQFFLDIGDNVLAYDAFLSHIPFERLTHIHLSVPLTDGDCVSVLERCRRAVQVTFRFVTASHTRPSMRVEGTKVSLSLESLVVSSETDICSILSNFTCPVLRQLCIRVCHTAPSSTTEEDLPLLDNFIRESNLQQLIICDVWGSFEFAALYLLLDSVQDIPEVEVRVLSPSEAYLPVVVAKEYRCPVAGCSLPHLGWTRAFGQHLGTPLKDGTMALWESPCRQETLTSDWLANATLFKGFVDD
ncbi:hypothetical protein CC1G_00781 [Coprinopsis cinerea okayama7|uniref:Uncharacterized protein n=1 Tax=Coprinopsis cinerea (strain Okayama-7 / 130 / ATCC MYA-4618 / FGSC 9003) TaxID=240176 RepID=A8N8Q6_COPC7|nr:hypothetical protein CC1G_00781 [Coprinopsis cinerea okayama7\|eukprot:XP_001831234.2 hypothetical protein CC1G_00781 [Coprinopsis cinerea okayama7\